MVTDLLPLTVFLSVSALMVGVFWMVNRRGGRLEGRLRELSGESTALPVAKRPARKKQSLWPSLDSALMPVNEEQRTRLEKRLYQAGLYHPWAVRVFLGGKLTLLVLGWVVVLALYLSGVLSLTIAVLLSMGWSAAGFFGPGKWPEMRTHKRQNRIRRGLPDMLDIFVLCLEGGLSVNSAFHRLVNEIGPVHPLLEAELNVVRWEVQLGQTLGEALTNMAQRCGVEEVRGLATMLNQSERYGVGLIKALRVHAETLRYKNLQEIEELAQKAAVKILFPTLLFIFPGVFIIILGPAALQMQAVMERLKPRNMSTIEKPLKPPPEKRR